MQFKDLGVHAPILHALEELRYKEPSPIQEGAIPPALEGRDILGLAQTGTGKTCAFAVPILQTLAKAQLKGLRSPRALIVTPTRELAIQIHDSFKAYGKNLSFLKSAVLYGGVGQGPQVQALRRSLDILIATPGRLLDLHGQGYVDLTSIDILVLDEADRMLDMGFFPDVKRILAQLPHEKQTMLFSATMPKEVTEIVNRLLKDPVTVQVAPVSSPVEVITQQLYYVDKGNKSRLLAHLMEEQSIRTALVFTRTKHAANKVAGDMEKAGISAAAIHGNKSQTARVAALNLFKHKQIRVLVATDIAARGIDIDKLTHVVNYNLPEVPETYVHRIGRTGRAGRDGTAISFCDVDEKGYLKDIERLMKRSIDVVTGHPFPLQNTAPTPTKNGRKVNSDDEDARQAARDRKRARMDAEKQAQAKRQGGQKNPNSGGKKPAEKPEQKVEKMIQNPTARRYARPEKKLEEFVAENTSKTSAPNQPRTRLSNSFANPQAAALDGDRVMDATARLLAPKTSGVSDKKNDKSAGQKSEASGRENQLKNQAKKQPSNQPRTQSQAKQNNQGNTTATSQQNASQKKSAQDGSKKSGQSSQKGQNSPSKNATRLPTRQGQPRRNLGPRRPDPAPPRETSEEFKPFYISFDD